MDSRKRKRIRILGKILFILYVIFIVYFLLFSDWYGRTGEMREYHYNLVLFKEIKRFWQYREQVGFFAMFTNLFGNVIIFIPFGFFLPMGSRQRSFIATAYYSFVLSLCVEVFQLITKVGSFDVDDLLLNTIGGICGYILFAICAAIRRRHAGKKTKKRGVYSCTYAVVIAFLVIVMILFSFLNKGNVNILIGFFGLGTCAMAVIGIWLGMKGFREREKIYTTCKVGITVNAVFLAVMVGLFVRGLM